MAKRAPDQQQTPARLESLSSAILPSHRPSISIPDGMELRAAVQTVIEALLTGQKRSKWQLFTSIEDWKQYFDLHPEWKGHTVGQMQNDRASGALAFVAAFSKWVSAQPSEQRKNLYCQLFPHYREPQSRTSWTSIEDWIREYSLHPKWHGLSIGQLENDNEGGGCAFVGSFRIWVNSEAAGDVNKRQKLISAIFSDYKITRERRTWGSLTTIQDWKAELAKHPGWKDKSISQIENDNSRGGAACIFAFRAWLKKETRGDEQNRQELMKEIFPDYQPQGERNDWSTFTTIESWRKELLKHQEWAGLSIGKLGRNTANGGRAFVNAFREWLRKTCEDDKAQRAAYIQILFPKYEGRRDWSELTTLDAWKREAKNHAELTGQTFGQLQSLGSGEASSFSQAFWAWAKEEARGDTLLQRAYNSTIFPYSRRLPSERWFSTLTDGQRPSDSQTLKKEVHLPEGIVTTYRISIHINNQTQDVWAVRPKDAPLMRKYFVEVIPRWAVEREVLTNTTAILSALGEK